jgi:hypothetical protein
MAGFSYNAGLTLKTQQVPNGVQVAESGVGSKQEYFNQPVIAGDFDLGAEIASIAAPCWISVVADQPFSLKIDANPASVFTVNEIQMKLIAGGAPVIKLTFAAPANLQILAVM